MIWSIPGLRGTRLPEIMGRQLWGSFTDGRACNTFDASTLNELFERELLLIKEILHHLKYPESRIRVVEGL